MAEQKKSVVKEAEYFLYKETQQKRRDSFGNYTIGVKFENGDFGYFSTKYDNNTAFKAGSEVDYLIEAKPKKTGDGTWYKITLPKKEFPQTTRGAWQGRTPKDMKFEARLDVMELCARMYIAGKIEYEQIKGIFVELYGALDTSIDELWRES